MSRLYRSFSSLPLTDRGIVTESSTYTRPSCHLATRIWWQLSMARLEFSSEVDVQTSPERAFDYFADHRHVAKVLEGVSRWQPIGERTRGTGARYSVEMLAFGFPLENVLRINRWTRPKEIGWVSETGPIKQEGGFTFTETPEGVRVKLRIAYEPPGSIVGAAVARRVDGVVRRRLDRAMQRIRQTLQS